MSFCNGCTHFLLQEVHNTKMPDGSYARGPGWVCDSPEAIRASQKEENYDPNIVTLLIGKVCWSCRGEYYSWDGKTQKPLDIIRLEQFRAQLVEEKVPVPETPTVASKSRFAKIRTTAVKKKRAEDPSKKRKSTNQGLIL